MMLTSCFVFSLTVNKAREHEDLPVQISPNPEPEARNYVEINKLNEREDVVYDEIGEFGLQLRNSATNCRHLPTRNSVQINDFYHSTEF